MSHRAAIKLSARAGVSSEDLTREGSASKLPYIVVGKIQFVLGHWTEGLVSSWLLGRGPQLFLTT